MYLQFPDSQTLVFAISSGLIPASTAAASCQGSRLADGAIVLKTSQRVPKKSLRQLAELNVKSTRLAPTRAALQDCISWLALVPLTTSGHDSGGEDDHGTLLVFPSWEALVEASREMFRLGNDRQAVRSVASRGKELHLLLVREPPMFSLLALCEEPGVCVFRAVTNNVWVQEQFTHALADRIEAPPKTLLLLSEAEGWQAISDAPFADLYERVDFAIPVPAERLGDSEESRRLSVKLSLKPDSNPAPPSLWIVPGHGREQLHEFVQSISNDITAQLAFAVANDSAGEEVLLIRSRGERGQSLTPPGVAYRTYLRIPNLFVPQGSRLHPPLRRDAAAKTLAPDPSIVVWLQQVEDSFRPIKIADDSFRPLADWVDYVVEQQSETLNAWVASSVFSFDAFICDDEAPTAKPATASANSELQVAGGDNSLAAEVDDDEEPPQSTPSQVAPLKRSDHKTVPVSKLRSDLRALEEKFLENEAVLEADSRVPLWLEMGRLHALLDDDAQAGLCFGNAVWDRDNVDSLQAWNSTLRERAPFDEMLRSSPAPSDAARFMGRVASAGDADQSFIKDNLAEIAERVTALESQAPIRTVWLAWLAVSRASGGDSLMLSRARDRILARLFEDGMRADVDLPLFLRNVEVDQERYAQVRDFLYQLPRRSSEWIQRQSSLNDSPSTQLFVNLSIAFGLARIGEHNVEDFLDSEPQQTDIASEWVRDVFKLRVEQVMRGDPFDGPLHDGLLSRLEQREFTSAAGGIRQNYRYLIDRLRSESQIIEPQSQVDPYRHITKLSNVAWRQLCLEMQETRDPKGLRAAIKQLLTETRSLRDPQPYCISVGACLECAPRGDQETAEQLLKLVPKAVAKCVVKPDVARIIKHGLYLAGHFDLDEYVQQLIGMFRKYLLEPRDIPSRKALDEALFECFDGLRRLGLRSDIEKLLDRLMRVADELGRSGSEAKAETTKELQMKLQLHSAAGRFYFGQVREAESILDRVRETMLSGGLSGQGRSRGILSTMALRYVKALRHAPIHIVVQRVDDLLANLQGVFDNYTTTVLYSRSQLNFLEECVLVLVSDDVALSTGGRKWLDDDEFLVRKRIHADVRAALEK